MTEIKFGGDTYRGTAEGDHGVFTRSGGGRVYAGQIDNGFACVGVATNTNGNTVFVECDADGEPHGRYLCCDADGDTWYYLCEHGRAKEWAVLYADGTCTYNNKACRADYAPFAALQAMVVPIKARPHQCPPQPPLFMPHSLAPTAPQVGPIGHCFGTRRSWRRPTPTRCALLRLSHQPARALWHSNCQTNAPRVQPGRRTGGRVLYACATTACVVHASAVPCPRSEPPCASALPITCRTPSGSVAACGGLHV